MSGETFSLGVNKYKNFWTRSYQVRTYKRQTDRVLPRKFYSLTQPQLTTYLCGYIYIERKNACGASVCNSKMVRDSECTSFGLFPTRGQLAFRWYITIFDLSGPLYDCILIQAYACWFLSHVYRSLAATA